MPLLRTQPDRETVKVPYQLEFRVSAGTPRRVAEALAKSGIWERGITQMRLLGYEWTGERVHLFGPFEDIPAEAAVVNTEAQHDAEQRNTEAWRLRTTWYYTAPKKLHRLDWLRRKQ